MRLFYRAAVICRALIADDEPLARQKLCDFLEPVPWVRCVAETADGPTTLQAVETLKPDLLFLDIRMPKMTGLDLLGRLTHLPHVVFTTAYDQYAVTAFEWHALDYLLKPFGRRRFEKTLERVRRTLLHPGPHALRVLETHRVLAMPSSGPPLFVREGSRIVPVALEEIEHLEARGDYVMLHVGLRRHLVHLRMKDFVARLDPERFLRVHRSHIINLGFVQAITPYDGHRLQVVLHNGTTVVASRAGSKVLRQLVR